MARSIQKFFTPGAARGRDSQVEAAAARDQRFETAVSASVAAARSVLSTEAERIEKIASELGLERFSDPLQEIDGRLVRAIEIAKARIEILGIERTLGGHAHVAGQGVTAPMSSQRKKDLSARLALLQQKIGEPATEPAPRPDGALPEAVERALGVLDAKPAAKRETPEQVRARLLDDVDTLEAARWELSELIEAHRQEASYEANLKAKGAHDALLIELYRAAVHFANVGAQEQTLRMTLPTLGLTARSDILPVPGDLMQAILILGRDFDHGSSLAAFMRFLADRDLLA
jgi:hypothetical protein